MPLPFFLIAGAVVAGSAGIGAGVAGACDMVKANRVTKEAQERDDRNLQRLSRKEEETSKVMDRLGKEELETLASFKEFSDLFERIKNRPTFADLKVDGFSLPDFDPKKIEEVSVGAAALVSGFGGAALGTLGGFAAAGATTAAVMALGTASTGTAISTLSGAAATNATLAALGGGSLAAGGGGVALGTTVLGAATLGVGLLVGGIIFCVAGSSVSKKAEDCLKVVDENEKKIEKICSYLFRLQCVAESYFQTFCRVECLYFAELCKMRKMIDYYSYFGHDVDWNSLVDDEKLNVQNVVLLVGVLYNMCKVKLVKQATSENELNEINFQDINKAKDEANACLKHFGAA